jgi:hypothetical protein
MKGHVDNIGEHKENYSKLSKKCSQEEEHN